MPTLVWKCRPKAAGGDSAREEVAAVPDPVGSAAAGAAAAALNVNATATTAVSDYPAVPGPVQVSEPAVSSKRGGRGKKRKINRTNAASVAKKKSKTASGGDLPQGVYKRSSGKFGSRIWWDGIYRYIGTFDTPELASAAFTLVKKDFAVAKLSAFCADRVDAIFDEAQKKAVDLFKGFVLEKRDLPTGVCRKKSSGKFQAKVQWGGKTRYIGTFDSPEQASAAFMSVKKHLAGAKPSALRADDALLVNDIFDAAKKKALESVGGVVRKKQKKSDLPRRVRKDDVWKVQIKDSMERQETLYWYF